MGDFYQNAVQHPEDVGVQSLRRTLNWNDPGLTGVASAQGLVNLGALPSGAMPLGVDVDVEVAFDADTTNVLEVGTSADLDGYATAAVTLSGAAGFKPNCQGALSGKPVLVDTQVNIYFLFTGTVPTAGKAHVVLKYAPKREKTGMTFPGAN